MTQERLDIPIGIDLSAIPAAMESLKKINSTVNLFGGGLSAANSNLNKIHQGSVQVANTLNMIANLSDQGLERYFIAGAEGIRVVDLELMKLQANDTAEKLQSTWEKWSTTISGTLKSMALLNSEVTQKVAERAIGRLTGQTNQLRIVAAEAGREVQKIGQGAQSPGVRVLPKAAAAAPSLGTMISVAAVAKQVSAMSRINNAMTSVKKTVTDTRLSFDRFRLAKSAPKVDPGFNVLKTAVEKTSDAVAGGIDNVRKAADASLDGWKDTAQAAAGGAQKISKSLDDVAASSAKYDWHVKAGIGSLKIMKAVFFPLRGMLQGYEDKLKTTAAATGAVSAKTSEAAMTAQVLAAKASGLAYIVTGTFDRGTGGASIYAGALKAILFPARMLFREFEGGKRVVNATMWTFSALMSPVRLVTNAIQRTRLESAMLNKALEGKSTAMKVAVKSAYALFSVMRPIAGVATLTARGVGLVAKAAFSVTTPVKAMAKSTGTAVKNLIMFGTTSVKAGSDAANLAASTGPVKAGMIGVSNAAKQTSKSITNVFIGRPSAMLKQLLTSKFALQAMAAAAIAWGASNAIATETATVKFGTLLGSMSQSKALLQEITTFSAMTPFSNTDLRESTGLLLAAQVPANAITDRLTMIGDIAAGTSQPIGEMTKIFAKVGNTGKLGLDSINQFAERGVPLYSALQDTLGVSREKLLEMTSKGQLGFADLDNALKSLTATGGMFAGGMAAQSETVAGLWSTLKDNVGIALESVMTAAVEGFKPLLAFGISFFQTLNAGLQKAQPVISAFFGVIRTLLMGVWSVGVQSFQMIGNVAMSALSLIGVSGGTTFGGLMEGLITFFALTKYTFENFPLAAAIAFDTTVLSFMQMGAAIAHWFTVTAPTYLDWFGTNFTRLFLDSAAFVGTVFTNLGANIKNAMLEIWDFIASGGTGSLSLAWTPLAEGFRKTIDDLPDIPERAISQLEVQMQADIDAMKTQFGEGVGDAVAKALETLKPPEQVELQGITAADTGIVEDTGAAGKNKRTSFVVDSLDRGSAEAIKAVFANQRQDKTPQQQLNEQKKTNILLAKVVNNKGTLAVAGAIP